MATKHFDFAARRDERAVLRIVGAVGQELQRQERMRGAAFAQVDLDRVDLPRAAIVAHGDEVDGEAAEHALLHQPASDLDGLAHDRRPVFDIGRKAAPEILLSARPAQHLIVRRERLDVAERRHAELRARTAEIGAGDPLFDDPAALGESGHVVVVAWRHPARSASRACTPRSRRARQRRRSGTGRGQLR